MSSTGEPQFHDTFSTDLFIQKFSVPFEYPVYFTHGLFEPGNPLLAALMDRLREKRRHRAVVYVDAGATQVLPRLSAEIQEYFHNHAEHVELAAPPMVVPGGETAKAGWECVREAMWTIGNLHLDRQSFVIAVGGGAVLDMVGFAAGILHRGLRLIRVPTTTLAQADAGIGVKNGMNEHGMKNFVGTFAPPFAVIDDFCFLQRLAMRDWIGGVAEAFKVAIIKDADFFDFLCAHAADLRNRQAGPMEQVVRRCALLHLEHIGGSGDPFEFGSARPLDFGHWAAHRLEMMSNHALGHGQAVAIGIALDSFYAVRQGLLCGEEFERILAGLLECGLPVWCEYLSARGTDTELSVLEGLAQFREHLGGSLCVTLPEGIGRRTEVHHVDTGMIEEAVEYLKAAGRKGK